MKKQCSSSGEDRDIISYLPDPIRSHIISALPLKEAIRTQILSTRWRTTWTSLSNLQLSQSEFSNASVYRNFVDKMVNSHDGTHIMRFFLTLSIDGEVISADHVNAWTTFAVEHNVQQFSLKILSLGGLDSLPCSLFTCGTLTALTLFAHDDLNWKWPGVIKLPKLKYLFIQNFVFDDENVTNKLFTSDACPVLDELCIGDYVMEGIQVLPISIETLVTLTLRSHSTVIVVLSTPALRKLHFAINLPPVISRESLASLVDVRFQLFDPDVVSNVSAVCTAAVASAARMLLMGLHNVDKVSLADDFIEIIARDQETLAHLPAFYCGVKTLHLEITPTEYNVRLLIIILRNCPHLQILSIKVEVPYWVPANIIPMEEHLQSNELSLNHLVRVQIKNFGGSVCEMDIVKLLLETASNLVRVDIHYSDEMTENVEERMKINEKLSSFKRVSPHSAVF